MITADSCKYRRRSLYEWKVGEYFSLVLQVWVSVEVTFCAHKLNAVLETGREILAPGEKPYS